MRAESIHRKIVTLFCFPPAIIILPSARSDILKPSVPPRASSIPPAQPAAAFLLIHFALGATALLYLFLPISRPAEPPSWGGQDKGGSRSIGSIGLGVSQQRLRLPCPWGPRLWDIPGDAPRGHKESDEERAKHGEQRNRLQNERFSLSATLPRSENPRLKEHNQILPDFFLKDPK